MHFTFLILISMLVHHAASDFAYVGCYKLYDGSSNGAQYFDPWVDVDSDSPRFGGIVATIEQCATRCANDDGFTLFGLIQFTNRASCFCQQSNMTTTNPAVPETSCSSAQGGNSTDASAIQHFFVSTYRFFPDRAFTIVNETDQIASLGCYRFEIVNLPLPQGAPFADVTFFEPLAATENGGQSIDLAGTVQTIEECALNCSSEEHFGLYGNQCFCQTAADLDDDAAPVDQSLCNLQGDQDHGGYTKIGQHQFFYVTLYQRLSQPTLAPTTVAPTTAAPTTPGKTTKAPTTKRPTTPAPTTAVRTTKVPTTRKSTTAAPTTAAPTTTVVATTTAPPTTSPTTVAPTTQAATTVVPTTIPPTTVVPTTVPLTTVVPTTVPLTTVVPTTLLPTTVAPTTATPSTVAPTPVPTTVVTTTAAPTTIATTTNRPTTSSPVTTRVPTTVVATTAAPTAPRACSKCIFGLKCCNTSSGYQCYDSKFQTCFSDNNVLCPNIKTFAACGQQCYDTRFQTCFNNSLLCPFGAVACGGQCYYSALQTCCNGALVPGRNAACTKKL